MSYELPGYLRMIDALRADVVIPEPFRIRTFW
jgi:hypothetical protein